MCNYIFSNTNDMQHYLLLLPSTQPLTPSPPPPPLLIRCNPINSKCLYLTIDGGRNYCKDIWCPWHKSNNKWYIKIMMYINYIFKYLFNYTNR